MNTGNRFTRTVGSFAIAATFFFTGCGGGDNQNTDTVAPSSLAGHSYNLQQAGDGATAVSFNSASDYTFQHTTGAVESGSYQAAQNGNNWSVTLLTDGGGQQIYNLAFSSSAGGTYTRHLDGQDDVTGTFSARDTAISNGNVDPSQNPIPAGGATTGATTGGSTGDTTFGSTTGSTTGATTGDTTGSTTGATTAGGGTTGNTTGVSTGSTTSTTSGSTSGSTTGGTVNPSTDYTGFAPVSIAGRVMNGTRTFTSTGPTGQTHVYTFANGTFHDSDSPEESGGNFTYSANNSTATLDLEYNTPDTFVGDHHHLTLNFSARDVGQFQSIYTRGDGTTIVINGDFNFDPLQ